MSGFVPRALVALSLLLAACDSTADTDGYKEVACSFKLSNRPLFEDLRPVPGVEAIQLRSSREPRSPADPPSNALTAWGQTCATARDPSACQTAVDESRPSDGFHFSCYEDTCSYQFLLTTRGDEVRTHSTPAAITEVLGTVDTEQEAVLSVYGLGYDFLCYKVDQGGVKTNPDGSFNVIGFRGIQCDRDIPITQHVFHVATSGEVREMESHVLRGGEESCDFEPHLTSL
ncbi:hypothetical protein [Corallococcus exercitus]|uniref:Lipoprotein n=1 Tax=Corallococcus exercitus TaxID=2316736 RepID=A0A7Y4NEQ5_9BACT|nr:hypothetical protein [Corallococcus exercitus]NOK11214.1 hypothetical protein [Corallococcus exercitus]